MSSTPLWVNLRVFLIKLIKTYFILTWSPISKSGRDSSLSYYDKKASSCDNTWQPGLVSFAKLLNYIFVLIILTWGANMLSMKLKVSAGAKRSFLISNWFRFINRKSNWSFIRHKSRLIYEMTNQIVSFAIPFKLLRLKKLSRSMSIELKGVRNSFDIMIWSFFIYSWQFSYSIIFFS